MIFKFNVHSNFFYTMITVQSYKKDINRQIKNEAIPY
jgi:hypothetical protein